MHSLLARLFHTRNKESLEVTSLLNIFHIASLQFLCCSLGASDLLFKFRYTLVIRVLKLLHIALDFAADLFGSHLGSKNDIKKLVES